jgi:hypothetical protein
LLEEFSQLLCDFKEAERKIILEFFQKTAKYVKTISAHSKSAVLIS